MKRLLLVTGRPSIGKTTVLLNVANELEAKNYCVGGMISKEARREGRRVGFEVVDFKTGVKGWLAHAEQPVGPRMGKYRVNLEDLDSIGAKAILDASRNDDVIIIDEIGPMELLSRAFRQSVIEALNSGKPVLGAIHHSARNPIIDSIKKRDDASIVTVDFANRIHLHNILIQNALQYLRERER